MKIKVTINARRQHLPNRASVLRVEPRKWEVKKPASRPQENYPNVRAKRTSSRRRRSVEARRNEMQQIGRTEKVGQFVFITPTPATCSAGAARPADWLVRLTDWLCGWLKRGAVSECCICAYIFTRVFLVLAAIAFLLGRSSKIYLVQFA